MLVYGIIQGVVVTDCHQYIKISNVGVSGFVWITEVENSGGGTIVVTHNLVLIKFCTLGA